MCAKILSKEGDLVVETPNQFESYFGQMPITWDYFQKEIHGNNCLCSVDLESSFRMLGIDYEIDPDDSHWITLK